MCWIVARCGAAVLRATRCSAAFPTKGLFRSPQSCNSAEEVRGMFERYGKVRDVYLPRDYHTQ